MQNKDKGDGIEDSPLDMLLVMLLEGASKEVVMPSSSLGHVLGLRGNWALEVIFDQKGELGQMGQE